MKRRNREFNIFNLSFLDVISCGFGAVVMLILIAKPVDEIVTIGQDKIEGLLQNLIGLENSLSSLQQDISSQLAEWNSLASSNEKLEQQASGMQAEIERQKQAEAKLAGDLEGLSLVESTLKQASTPTPKPSVNKRDEEVGGIPVDSDYVIFVIDTSGSMQQIWPRVSSEIINVLNIHPKVKGFQILNDMGRSIVSGYDGKWMPDTPGRRKSIISLFYQWADYSNSSPVEGIEIALRKYARPNISTSIYVFGDDYTGSSYDPVIDSITRKNTQGKDDNRLAKIHGIGFRSIGTTDRFGILMREMTKRNGGTYLALP